MRRDWPSIRRQLRPCRLKRAGPGDVTQSPPCWQRKIDRFALNNLQRPEMIVIIIIFFYMRFKHTYTHIHTHTHTRVPEPSKQINSALFKSFENIDWGIGENDGSSSVNWNRFPGVDCNKWRAHANGQFQLISPPINEECGGQEKASQIVIGFQMNLQINEKKKKIRERERERMKKG